MNLYFNQILAIVWKDFVTEFKTRELFSSMFIFALLVILIFIFSINLSIVKASEVGPGVLWVAFLFSGTIGLNRSFILEKENGCLMGLMLVPADRTAIYFGKLISNFIFLSIMEIFILPLFMIFFNVNILAHLGSHFITVCAAGLHFDASPCKFFKKSAALAVSGAWSMGRGQLSRMRRTSGRAPLGASDVLQ